MLLLSLDTASTTLSLSLLENSTVLASFDEEEEFVALTESDDDEFFI